MFWILVATGIAAQLFPEPGLCREGMNEYHSLMAILRSARDSIPAKDRTQKAADLGTRVRKAMESCDFASFRLRICYFWTIEGSKESAKPLREWKLHEEHDVEIVSSGKQVAAHVVINGKPLYDYFYNQGHAREFKHPWNGVKGQAAVYESDGYFHLRDGVESRLDLDCEVAALLTPYVGPESTLASPYESCIRTGEWLGTVEGPHGERCDLVCITSDPDEEDGQWDYYLIGQRGLIVQKYRFRAVRKITKSVSGLSEFNRAMYVMTFDDFCTTAPKPSAFVPSRALLELSKDWKDVSEKVKATRQKEAQATSADSALPSGPGDSAKRPVPDK